MAISFLLSETVATVLAATVAWATGEINNRAERVGFEPTVAKRLHALSRRA